MDKIKFKVSVVNKIYKTLSLELLVNGKNILEWKENGAVYTTQYDLSDIVDYFILNTVEFANNSDDFPYDITANNLLELADICYSKEFDDEDEEIEFFENIHEYFYNHTIGHASGGAIIANLYFRHIDDYMEISWDNSDEEQEFTNKKGVVFISVNEYLEAVWDLKNQYNKLIKD